MASIRCAHCRETHTSVEDVRQCAYGEWAAQAEYEAERAAELAAERYWEERGGYDDDPRERELWMLEDDRRRENEAYYLAVLPPGTFFDFD